MVDMPALRNVTIALLIAARATRRVTAGSVHTGRFVVHHVGSARRRGGAGEAGMIRLLDLHAASCAGDTLVAIALAGTIFFSVPTGEARGKVALYLLVTMLPFALLAPVVGPVLDRFRHGRRYALAVTMLGRAFLAWLIADYIHGLGLYPAAFGVLVLSRAYGVARSAAVPRVLPDTLGLSEAGARASVFGTAAGAVAAPVGLAVYAAAGPSWTLRLGALMFLAGMVVALRLPARTDSQPPEAVPRPLQPRGRKGAQVLSGRLVVASLAGSATLRALYGFLTLFLAFSIRLGGLSRTVLGGRLSETAAIGLAAGALAGGSFLATAVGTTLRIRRPALVQAVAVTVAAVAAVVATVRPTLLVVVVLCLLTAVGSGLAKLAVDAVIQERVPERVRASAFAHSETLLMLAWVAGGAVGLIPFAGRLGLGVASACLVLAAVRALAVAARLRRERLRGAPAPEDGTVEPEAPTGAVPAEPATGRGWRIRRRPAPGATTANPTTGPTTTAASAEAGTGILVEPDETQLAPPGYHLYRPSGLAGSAEDDR
jgi:MFS family permease